MMEQGQRPSARFVEEAQYAGLCVECKNPTKQKEPIYWSREMGVWHQKCYEDKYGKPMSREEEITAKIKERANSYLAENMEACIAAYKRQFADLPYSTGAPILAQLLQLRHAFITSERIQAYKEKNTKAWRRR